MQVKETVLGALALVSFNAFAGVVDVENTSDREIQYELQAPSHPNWTPLLVAQGNLGRGQKVRIAGETYPPQYVGHIVPVQIKMTRDGEALFTPCNVYTKMVKADPVSERMEISTDCGPGVRVAKLANYSMTITYTGHSEQLMNNEN